jgi:hypothetical protein
LALFSFFFSGPQHFHAGVNEWLMDRHRGRVFFTWLPIGRCDLSHGQGMSQPRPAAMGHASGNIRAAILLMPLWFFRRSGAYQKKIPAATPAGEGYCPFAQAIPLGHPAFYTEIRISSVT